MYDFSGMLVTVRMTTSLDSKNANSGLFFNVENDSENDSRSQASLL